MKNCNWSTDNTTGSLLDYPYFKDHYRMKTIDLSKQLALDATPKAIQQINFTGNLSQRGGATIASLLKKQKKPF